MHTKYLNELSDEFLKLKTTHEIASFLDALLTPKEIREIPKRLQIIKLLKRGMSQRDVAEKLKVGIATVSRGSRELLHGNFKNIE
ncbi:helix-turn-helix domain-containing protein [Candidatus Woesebacteria bacterium]|nr:helix-turn-helix domain-containing protein [Candidatus Woesebacteria bacterium]